jgi:hypothetical protein
MKEDVVDQAGLTRPEVIAVVLYTGPIVSQPYAVSPQKNADLYNIT